MSDAGPERGAAARPPPAASSGTIVALVAAALYLAHALATNRVVDDCYITFRYVRNWVAGFGPVFNPGQRVEGYTNFLWTALLAAVNRVAPQLSLLHVAQALSLACGVLLLLKVGRCAFARGGPPTALRGFAPLLLALDAPFVVWSTGGLETILFALLVMGAALAELDDDAAGRGGWRAPLLLALATMTRPDGIVFVGALLLFRLARSLRGSGRGSRSVFAALLLFVLVYGPYWVWRWRYYGWPVPNTFYAKVGSGLAQWKRGVGYVRDWVEGGAFVVAALPLLALARRFREPRVQLFALFLAAGLFYVVAVGGESLGLFRFMVPLAPFFALLAQEGLEELVVLVRGADRAASSRSRGFAAQAAGVALAVVAIAAAARPTLGPLLLPESFHMTEAQTGLTFPGDGVAHSYRWFDNYFVDRLAVAGRWLDAHAPPDAWVASSPAGSIGFHMRQPLLDMLGLNDEHIAHESVPDMGKGRAGHEKGDGRYVLSRRPRYVLLGNVAVFDHELTDSELETRCRRLKSERELFADPEFHRLYAKRSVPIAETDAALAPIAPENRRLFRVFTFFELKDADASAH